MSQAMWKVLYIMATVVISVFAGRSKKDHYRFISDMPTAEEAPGDSDNPYPHPEDHFGGGMMPTSRCRHNYNERTEAGINRQINFYMHTAYVYNSMAQYFGSCDIALQGFEKYFRGMATEQSEHIGKLMKYQNMRGGQINLQQITAPVTSNWGSGLDAMTQAMELEKSVNQELLELHLVATQHDDIHAANFIYNNFLNPQVEKIFTMSQYITNLERVGPGLGEYMFDKLPQS